MKNIINSPFIKLIFLVILIIVLWIIIIYYSWYNHLGKTNFISQNLSNNKIIIPDLSTSWGISFYSWALSQIGIVNKYDFSNWYYNNWWFPPADIWVCSDIIRQTFKEIGIDFKDLIDDDIQENLKIYDTNFDSNINFRRVKNIDIFFKRKAKNLTNDLIPNDINNLKEWQTWDIVTFEKLPWKGLWHIAIISNFRWDNWVPYMLDNHWDWVNITITPLDWPTKIIWHYRYF